MGTSSPAQAVPNSVYGFVCSVADYGTSIGLTLYSGKGCTGSYTGWYSLAQSSKPEPVYSQTVNRLQQQMFQQKSIYIYSDTNGNISYLVYYLN
jgi:hypothetical protein